MTSLEGQIPQKLPEVSSGTLTPHVPLTGEIHSKIQIAAQKANETLFPESDTKLIPAPRPQTTTTDVVVLQLNQSSIDEIVSVNQSMIGKIKAQLDRNQHNTTWLRKEKAWAEGQVTKIQQLQSRNVESGTDVAKVNGRIQEMLKEYSTLINLLDRKISDAPATTLPKLSFHATTQPVFEKLTSFITKYTGKIFDIIQGINKFSPIFDQCNHLMGELTFSGNERLVFGTFLKDIEKPDLKNFLEDITGYKSLTPVIKDFLSEVKEVREAQIKSVKEGKGTLPVEDARLYQLAKLGKELEFAIVQLYWDEKTYDMTSEGKILTKLLSSLTERALVRNNQVITDLLYPDCVLYDSGKIQVSFPTLTRTLTNYAKAEKNIGLTKGFLTRGSSNLFERRMWEGVETQNGIFREGFCKLSFLSAKGHQTDAGAHFDLKPLGDLNRDQVKVIFDFATDLLKGGQKYDLIIERYKDSLGMTEEQLISLKTIMTKFVHEMEEVLTLSLISVGSKEFATTPSGT